MVTDIKGVIAVFSSTNVARVCMKGNEFMAFFLVNVNESSVLRLSGNTAKIWGGGTTNA
jgi:hypothetical protein